MLKRWGGRVLLVQCGVLWDWFPCRIEGEGIRLQRNIRKMFRRWVHLQPWPIGRVRFARAQSMTLRRLFRLVERNGKSLVVETVRFSSTPRRRSREWSQRDCLFFARERAITAFVGPNTSRTRITANWVEYFDISSFCKSLSLYASRFCRYLVIILDVFSVESLAFDQKLSVDLRFSTLRFGAKKKFDVLPNSVTPD